MFEYTREIVEQVLDEMWRRYDFDVMNGEYSKREAEYLYMDMMNGVDSALMVTAKNWWEVVQWIAEIEKENGRG